VKTLAECVLIAQTLCSMSSSSPREESEKQKRNERDLVSPFQHE
jgi:hypothetical protein